MNEIAAEITTDDLFAQLQEAYGRIAILEVQNRTLLRTISEMRQPTPEPEPAPAESAEAPA